MTSYVSGDQLLAHLIGDYVIQSHWMANEKTKRSVAALAHVVTYAIPFLVLTRDPYALGIIVGTHFVIDRWRLARYVCWLKNLMLGPAFMEISDLPIGASHPMKWANCSKTGYPADTPDWLAVWLLIVADNTLHLICNAVALNLFPG